MVRKLKEMVTADQKAMADAVLGSAQQIWQAGLGAFAKAQQEGSELFDKLVREGSELHRLTQKLAGDQPLGVADKVGRMAENVGRQASGSWDKIEKIFEDRVARSLRILGVPARGELDELRQEIAALKASMAEAGKPKAVKRSAAPKPAVKAAAKAPAKAAKSAPQKSRTGAAPKRAAKAAARQP